MAKGHYSKVEHFCTFQHHEWEQFAKPGNASPAAAETTSGSRIQTCSSPSSDLSCRTQLYSPSMGEMAERRQKSNKIWLKITVSSIQYKTSESRNNTLQKLFLRLINMSILHMWMVIIWYYHLMIVLYTKYWFYLDFHTESQFT